MSLEGSDEEGQRRPSGDGLDEETVELEIPVTPFGIPKGYVVVQEGESDVLRGDAGKKVSSKLERREEKEEPVELTFQSFETRQARERTFLLSMMSATLSGGWMYAWSSIPARMISRWSSKGREGSLRGEEGRRRGGRDQLRVPLFVASPSPVLGQDSHGRESFDGYSSKRFGERRSKSQVNVEREGGRKVSS